MWSILRTLTKFCVSGHLKIRWVLDGYSDRFWRASGGGSWEPKSIKLALRGQYVRKKVLLERFVWVLKKTGQLEIPKSTQNDLNLAPSWVPRGSIWRSRWCSIKKDVIPQI